MAVLMKLLVGKNILLDVHRGPSTFQDGVGVLSAWFSTDTWQAMS